MPRFTHPIDWELTNTDENRPGPPRIRMRAEIGVEVEDMTGRWRELNVVVDTGASYSMIGTGVARGLILTVPPPSGTITLRTATGLATSPIRDGEIHLRFTQLPGHTFRLKCVFRDNQPPGVPPVLGLHNTIDLLNILFDGSQRPDAFMGCMTFIIPDA